ncbi:TIP-1 family-domain-containing protein [Fennellomyces sp. T-0311]|nr:TIP-1 family-domain-containing protein [Fennellomyces sp. T-0311]
MQHVENEPEKSILPYQQLVKFAQLFKSHSQADSALAQEIHRHATTLYSDMTTVLSNNFKTCLNELGWPTPIRPPYGLEVRAKLDKFEKQVRNLAALRCPDFKSADTPLPIAIMLDALSLRFRFHFESSKPTNRLDKPEWYLSHVKTTISSHLPFLVTTVQPVLSDILGKDFSAKDCFIRELLKNVSRKLKHSVPKLRGRPQWLSHTIHETLDFDKTLQEEYAYGNSSMASILLDEPETYQAWFTAEKKFAQTRYDEIAVDSQAYEPLEDDDGRGSNIGVKPTRIAIKLINLLKSITDTYKSVPRLDQKLDFFLEIQLGLLNQFLGRLTSALDSFEAMNLIRTVPVPGNLPEAVTGVMTSADYGGPISALKRLSRWWASARLVCRALDECADDDFFLDMQYQVRNDMGSIETLIASKKEQDPNLAFVHIPETPDKTFLSLSKDAFEQLNQRAEDVMIRVIMKEWATDARMYARSWQMDTEDSDEEISSELYQPLQGLRMCCTYLSANIPQADFVSIYRRLSGEIEEWHMRNVVAPNRLEAAELRRLAKDLNLGLWKIGRIWVSKPENYMRKLRAATATDEACDS